MTIGQSSSTSWFHISRVRTSRIISLDAQWSRSLLEPTTQIKSSRFLFSWVPGTLNYDFLSCEVLTETDLLYKSLLQSMTMIFSRFRDLWLWSLIAFVLPIAEIVIALDEWSRSPLWSTSMIFSQVFTSQILTTLLFDLSTLRVNDMLISRHVSYHDGWFWCFSKFCEPVFSMYIQRFNVSALYLDHTDMICFLSYWTVEIFPPLYLLLLV